MISKAESFAELYINGGVEYRGKWNECWREAGFNQQPARTDNGIKAAIVVAKDRRATELQETLDNELVQMGSDFDGDFHRVAQILVPIQAAIAAGQLRAAPGQIQALEKIILRGYGKIIEKQKELNAPGIVILPMMGEGAEAHICPHCLEWIEEGDEFVAPQEQE